MLDSCWYRVGSNQNPRSFPNMLSLTFCFSPVEIPLSDPTGLVTADSPPSADEGRLAMRILDSIGHFTDLDREIDSDATLYGRLVQRSQELLRAARYSVDDYPAWAECEKIQFNRH